MTRYDFSRSVVQEAGEMILFLRQHVNISIKNNDPRDIVTNVDLEVSSFILNRIKEKFPGEIVYSEEAADVDVSSGSFWSIDPIDGTSIFARGLPHYSVVVAYVEHGVPMTGAIYNPVTKELFSFEKGRGAFFDTKEVRVSNVKKLSESYILLRAGRNKELWNWGMNAYKFLLDNANKTFNFGSSALDICFVGAGRVEACVYGNLTPIDIIAAIGFAKEAGGLVVGRDGKELTGLSKEKQLVVVANNKEILEALREGINF